MNNKKTELAKLLFNAHRAHQKKEIDDLAMSQKIADINKEGYLHHMAPNEIMCEVMNNSDAWHKEIADAEEKKRKEHEVDIERKRREAMYGTNH